MFDPDTLKKIALAKRKERADTIALEKNPDTKMEFTEDDIETYSKDLEGHVTAFAEDGQLAVNYSFSDTHSMALFKAVAQHFKEKHPRLMVITSDGQKTITVTWDGMNHV